MYYMENFHWPPSDTDRLSYVLVTFHAAMEYIRGPDVNHLLPKSSVVVRVPQKCVFLHFCTDLQDAAFTTPKISFNPSTLLEP